MIKEKVRKEICLLLVFAVIFSLTSNTVVFAAAETTTSQQETLTQEPLASSSTASDLTDEPSPSPTDIVPITDTETPVISGELPALNITQLHLIAGGSSYELHVTHAINASYVLQAENPSIATLSNETAQSVIITPNSAGQAVLSVTATSYDGTKTELSCQIIISALSLEKDSVDIYMNDEDHNADIAIEGIDMDAVYYGTGNDWEDERIVDAIMYHPQCSIQTGNEEVADAWFSDGFVHVEGISKGITNARLNIYGFPLSLRINVHHYTLNKYTINTYKGSPVKSLKLKGADGHKVTWTSGNENVASVSKTGIVTIKNIGTTKITAKANGRKAICIVSVSSKTAYRVIKDARAISLKKNIQYSQEKRMLKNYYDCSSLVYRCYRPYGIRFGYTRPSWAPTAAEEGYWCASSGHKIATQAVDIFSCKLVPGDTIYYSFNGNNGRYLDIDHTAIFSGYAYDDSIGYYGMVIEASSTSNTVTERMYYDSDSIRLIGRPSKK